MIYHKLQSVSIAASRRPSAVAVGVFEKSDAVPSGYAAVDRRMGGALAAGLKRREFVAAKGAITCLYPEKGGRLYVLGLGARESFSLDALRLAGAALLKAAWQARLSAVHLDIAPILTEVEPERSASEGDVGRALGEGMQLARFDFDTYKGSVSRRNGNGADRKLALKVHLAAAMRQGFDRGLIVGEGANLARTLAATPPNVANPKYLVDYARRMAKQVGLDCKVIDAQRARRMGMGGLAAVGRAGSTPPAMICLEYRPKRLKSRTSSLKPVLLVGKAITFDTGGYSLKINNGMLGMKYDKCGGMAVLGAMHAIAHLKPNVPVVGILAAAENMVDTTAFRPNDIIRMFNGVSVEVTNTDAEGRLVLADALAYGCKTYRPQAVLDLATLTGGVVVALGNACAGLFCEDAALRERVMQAACHSGERVWQLPLWDEHRELMRGSHSDIVNSGADRGAAPIQGAAFLSYFATPDGDPTKLGQLPWAHLDIAGVAESKSDTALIGKGPTGYGVRLLTRLLEMWK